MDEAKHPNILLVTQPHERIECGAVCGDASFLRLMGAKGNGEATLFRQFQETEHVRILCDGQSTKLVPHGNSFTEAELQGKELSFFLNREIEENTAENGEVIRPVENYLSLTGVHAVDDVVLTIAVRDLDGICDHRIVILRNLCSAGMVKEPLNLRADLEILVVDPHVLLILVGAFDVIIHD